jgi:hypothetical protein
MTWKWLSIQCALKTSGIWFLMSSHLVTCIQITCLVRECLPLCGLCSPYCEMLAKQHDLCHAELFLEETWKEEAFLGPPPDSSPFSLWSYVLWHSCWDHPGSLGLLCSLDRLRTRGRRAIKAGRLEPSMSSNFVLDLGDAKTECFYVSTPHLKSWHMQIQIL